MRGCSALLATVETIYCLSVLSPDVTYAALPAELGAFCLSGMVNGNRACFVKQLMQHNGTAFFSVLSS